MLAKPSKKTAEDGMSSFNMARAFGIMMVAALAAGVTSPASASSDRSGKFAAPSWPEETIYRPECRTVQADGSWRPCGPAERDW
jgi:hypothetical protein